MTVLRTGRPGRARRISVSLGAGLALGVLPAAAVPVAAAPARAAAARPAVVIVLDTNTSLAGWGIGQEQAALAAYLQALPANALAGLITFGSRQRRAGLGPAAGRKRFAAALTASPPAEATSAGLASALAAAAAELAGLPRRASGRLVVVSDAEQLTGSLPGVPRFPTDVIVLGHDRDDNGGLLQALAIATRGHAEAWASAAALARLFPAASDRVLKAPRRGSPKAGPRPPAGRVSQAKGPAAQAPGLAALPGSQRSLAVLLAGTFVVLLLIGLLLARPFARADRRKRLVSQIERYGPKHAPAPETEPAAKERKAASVAIGWASALLRSMNAERRLAERLEQAGTSRRPAEWVLIGSLAGLVLAVMLTVVTSSPLLGIPAGALISWTVMRVLTSARIARRRSAFAQQLPEALQYIAGSLRSGFSLQQSIDGVVREDGQPAAGELARALAEARIGIDLDVALETVANRMDSSDFRWTVMAIRIHREVGGNLAEVLDNTAGTIRERAFLRRHVRGLSAEGRLSAYVLIALPLLIGTWLLLTDRAYLRPLFTTGLGLAMIGGAVVLFVLGTLWMRKLVNVEV